MADGDLFQEDFGIAFAFGRSEVAAYVDANGDEQTAPIDTPRFDHDDVGTARGLLITPGSDLGTQDRIGLDALMLPEALVEGPRPSDLEATVFHAFVPAGVDPWVVERRAWYSRNAKATIDGLLAQAGHHLEIGVITGFRKNLGGFVRLRGQVWTLAGLLVDQVDGAALLTAADEGKPIVVAGAEVI